MLGLSYLIGVLATPDLTRADSIGYHAYLRSLAFDGDLDFTNEWARWGHPQAPISPTGRMVNPYPVGPALLWAPFFALGHIFVVLTQSLGQSAWEPDGYSEPYLRACALGTLTLAVLGLWLLRELMRAKVGSAVSTIAAVTAVATSPVLYYLFVQPLMPHGLAFGVAAAILWAVERARRRRVRADYLLVGVLCGALLLVRLQAVVFLLLPAAILGYDGVRRRARMSDLAIAAAGALLAFLPQLLAWKMVFGDFVMLPQGYGLLRGERAGEPGAWFDWQSPHLLDTIVSAQRGFFTWTPLMGVASIGLLLGWRRWRSLSVLGFAVFVACAWINGAVGDWLGGDAFGARRFSFVVPFMALGLATLLELSRRHPLVAPTAFALAFVLWNAGLVRLFQMGVYRQVAPLEQVVWSQARQFRKGTERAVEDLVGPRGRNLVYRVLVGEYLHQNLNRSGTIDLSRAGFRFRNDPDGWDVTRYLYGGWSSPRNRHGPPAFRAASFPAACLQLPLASPKLDLQATVTARRHHPRLRQVMTVNLNGMPLERFELAERWEEHRFVLPRQVLRAGENPLCFAFSTEPPVINGERFAADVTRLQLRY